MTDHTTSAERADAPSAGHRRVFYALWPDAPAAEALDALAQRIAVDTAGRATAGQRLHLTLAFVGSVPVSDIERLVTIGRDVASRAAPFMLTFDRVGAFRDAGIAWIGAAETPLPLQQLALDLKAELAAGGFRVDARAFKAHITLARRCQRRPRITDAPSISWNVDAISLMASELTPAGPHYTELAAPRITARPSEGDP